MIKHNKNYLLCNYSRQHCYNLVLCCAVFCIYFYCELSSSSHCVRWMPEVWNTASNKYRRLKSTRALIQWLNKEQGQYCVNIRVNILQKTLHLKTFYSNISVQLMTDPCEILPWLGAVAQFVVEAAALSRTGAAERRKATQRQRKTPERAAGHLLCCGAGRASEALIHAASLCRSSTFCSLCSESPDKRDRAD